MCGTPSIHPHPHPHTTHTALSARKCYELLGNSIHVGVATQLLHCLLPPAEEASSSSTTAAAAAAGDVSGVVVGVGTNPLFACACALAPLVEVCEEEGDDDGKGGLEAAAVAATPSS